MVDAAARLTRSDTELERSLMRWAPAAAQHWRRRAACRTTPTDVFFRDDTTEAAAICARCNVRPECADWSITDRAQLGYVGGMTETERKAARWSVVQNR